MVTLLILIFVGLNLNLLNILIEIEIEYVRVLIGINVLVRIYKCQYICSMTKCSCIYNIKKTKLEFKWTKEK